MVASLLAKVSKELGRIDARPDRLDHIRPVRPKGLRKLLRQESLQRGDVHFGRYDRHHAPSPLPSRLMINRIVWLH